METFGRESRGVKYMTKEKLEMELENYKRLYKTEKEKREELEKERENIEEYRLLNLDLQVEVKNLNKKINNLVNDNMILSHKNNTYETVFDVLNNSKVD